MMAKSTFAAANFTSRTLPSTGLICGSLALLASAFSISIISG